jgi:hypothetical protein
MPYLWLKPFKALHLLSPNNLTPYGVFILLLHEGLSSYLLNAMWKSKENCIFKLIDAGNQ